MLALKVEKRATQAAFQPKFAEADGDSKERQAVLRHLDALCAQVTKSLALLLCFADV